MWIPLEVLCIYVQVLVGDPMQLQAHSEFYNTHLPADKGGLQECMEHHSRSAMQVWTGRHAVILLSRRSRCYRCSAMCCQLPADLRSAP